MIREIRLPVNISASKLKWKLAEEKGRSLTPEEEHVIDVTLKVWEKELKKPFGTQRFLANWPKKSYQDKIDREVKEIIAKERNP
jgi:lysophospholipid acyltransferase (LPLAT)-like uncharacterized protein